MKTIASTPDRTRDGYEDFLKVLTVQFQNNMEQYGRNGIFTTDATGLFDNFLEYLPDEARQHYTCHACRRFVEKYGGLIVLEGEIKKPLMWGWEEDRGWPDFFKVPIIRMRTQIALAKVTGVFLSSDEVWGQPVTGDWHHMAVVPPADIVWRSKIQTADQAMAEKREDFKTLFSALSEYPITAVQQAIKLLKTDSLYRSEKTLGVAEWFLDVHKRVQAVIGNAKRNVIWSAVATAPAGWCHIKSTMIGTLLDDIMYGFSFDIISKRFALKMHPLQYQRPQALPSQENIAQAEKIVEQLGIAPSLERRFARLDEVNAIWRPRTAVPDTPSGNGVFGHLRTKDGPQQVNDIETPPVVMTWSKFLASEILADAYEIELYVHPRENFTALVTAAHEDAPPILQWDLEDARNPVSWYVYPGGSPCHQFNLSAGWCPVTAVTFLPPAWNGDHHSIVHHGESAIFILKGCKDLECSGNAIFPETLKKELHSIRATIEAYSKTAVLQGLEDASACGVRLQKGLDWSADIRVTSDLGRVRYRLDRWD